MDSSQHNSGQTEVSQLEAVYIKQEPPSAEDILQSTGLEEDPTRGEIYIKQENLGQEEHPSFSEWSGSAYTCYHCGVIRSSFKTLKAHIRKCPEGVIKDASSYQYKLHPSIVTSGDDAKSPNEDFPERPSPPVRTPKKRKTGRSRQLNSCSYCGYSTARAANLKTHVMIKHTNEKPFSCPYCCYSAAQSSKIKRHIMYKHSEGKSYSCPHCSYTGTNEPSFKAHIANQHSQEDRKHRCPHCEFSTRRTPNLKLHIMTKHTSEKPYFCTYCSYRAVQATKIKRHIMARHTNEKPHSCPYCSYCAVLSTNLRKHINKKHPHEVTIFCS